MSRCLRREKTKMQISTPDRRKSQATCYGQFFFPARCIEWPFEWTCGLRLSLLIMSNRAKNVKFMSSFEEQSETKQLSHAKWDGAWAITYSCKDFRNFSCKKHKEFIKVWILWSIQKKVCKSCDSTSLPCRGRSYKQSPLKREAVKNLNQKIKRH